MKMNIEKKIKNYQSFFSDQVREAELEQKTIIKAPMNLLFKKEEILIGYVDHVNDALGISKRQSTTFKGSKIYCGIKKRCQNGIGTKRDFVELHVLGLLQKHELSF